MKQLSAFICDQEGNIRGALDMSPGLLIVFSSDFPPELQEKIRRAEEAGISYPVEVFDEKKDVRVLAFQHAESGDAQLPTAMANLIREAGYTLRWRHPEVEEELKIMLRDLPESIERDEVLARLPGMSLLEKTAIIEELRKENTPNHAT